jgi:hypothetical protein
MKGTYITFRFESLSESGKTSQWTILSENNDVLGHIDWFGRWRKYIFRPSFLTVYEEICLREIAEFIELQTKTHRAKARKAKA